MSKSTPSLLALLGLVAVAGYQNRGRISEMLADARRTPANPAPDAARVAESGTAGGFAAELGSLFGAGAAGGTLASGLGDLVARFRESGQQAPAESWVSDRPNMPIEVEVPEAAIGHETLDELGQKTGLARRELLLRLNAALPDAVNRLTPQGRLPTEDEVRALR